MLHSKSPIRSVGHWLFLFLALPASTWAQPTSATPYSFTTLAGVSSIGSTDGTGSIARFNHPQGIAVDPSGNLFVADTENHTIRKITPTGAVTTLAGKAGYKTEPEHRGDGTGSDARFIYPMGLATDAAGNVYVADSDSLAIRKITPAGVVTTLAGGLPLSVFNVPEGVAVDPAGNVFVADTFNLAIRKITPAGAVTTLAGGSYGSADGTGSAAKFFNPQGIAIGPSGNVYVADTFNHTIRQITPAGVVTTLAGTALSSGSADGTGSAALFNYPRGIAVDPSGNLYVADSANSTIRKITPAGVVTTFAGQAGQAGHADGGAGTALFFQPEGLVSDQGGNIYVADTRDQTIRKITPAGIVSTVAGLSAFQSAGSTDGLAEARFRGPEGVAVGPAGELYVADRGNHTIRKVTATGAVTTLAGLAGAAGYADGAGSSARFSSPAAVAVDAGGRVYVADTGNSVIRRITPSGTVSTLAGRSGQAGYIDGPSGTALFGDLTGVAVDASGNVYVSETKRIRKITPAGQVTTLPDFSQPDTVLSDVAVDVAGNIYACDGTYEDVVKITPSGTVTRIMPHYFAPSRVAVDRDGNVFVTGAREQRVWKLTPEGVMSIIGGLSDTPGSTDGVGQDTRFEDPSGIAVDAAGNVYVTCSSLYSNTIRKGQLAGPPVISTQPQSQTVAPGGSVQFSVTASGVPATTYQWYYNGSAFNGATTNTLSFANARSTDAGDYTVVVTNELGAVTSSKATLTVSVAPAPTPTPDPVSGGGGGSIEGWFVVALLVLGAARRLAVRPTRS